MKKTNFVKRFAGGFSLGILLLATSCSTEELSSNELDADKNSLAKSASSVQLNVSSIIATATDGSNVAANAIDNDPTFSTRWSGYGDNVSLYIDFGSTVTLDYLKLAAYNGTTRTQRFEVWTGTSMSGPWSAFSGQLTTSGTTNGLQEFDLADKTSRYFRIKFTGNSLSLWNSVTDLEFYGTGNTTTIPTPTGDLDPNKKPSQNFDLSKWYLSVPINNGSGVATSISVSQLNAGYSNSTYFYTGNDGGMVFVNYPKDAVKTSTNTSYSRTELREMLDTSVSDTGLTKNNWVFSNSSSTNQSKAGGVGGTLKATLAVNRVTTTSTSTVQQGRTVIGQIHASSNEPCRLYYHKLASHAKGAIYYAHEDASGNEIFINVIGDYVQTSGSNAGDLNGSPSSPSDGIALDEKFSYTINVTGTTLTVTISRAGKSDIVKTTNMLNSGYANDWMYFKAGVYTQNKTATSSTDYDKATFYALTNTH